ncbi:uncharacterized protein LOC143214351 [Lasioglossum baleicum]|uniref:uncharacterized protein LOC143214351 n=1 Tax=Lasioglossum baleicum TaxID=434251 RepID=UPI003FCCCFD8
MATSDVLQFRYCTENEVARNATKNFAGMLGKVFEQYKKLWIRYLKLQKYCEDAGMKIPFHLFDPTSDNNDIVMLSQAAESCTDLSNEHASQMSSNHPKPSSLYKSLSTMCTLGNVLTENETVLANDKFVDRKQIVVNELPRSPELIKKRKSKKRYFTPGPAIVDDSDETNVFVPVREKITIVTNSSDENLSETSVENDENQFPSMLNNNDQIECTPLYKLPKKLGISKLYHVDTTLLQNGKKLKQSRLEFFPRKEIIDQKSHKELTSLVLPDNSGYRKDVDEEIIEDSPTKCIKSVSRMKSFKPRKNSRAKLREDNCRKDNLLVKFRDKIASLSQPLPAHTSTQKDELYPIKKLKTFSTSNNESIGSNNDILPSCVSPVLSDIEPKLKTENVNTSSASQAQERKLSKLANETCGYNSSCNDETFCLLGEKLKGKSTSIVNSIEKNKDELSKNVSHDFPPVKKSLMHSFDMVPEKEDVFTGKTKNKIERAKMVGTTCWECEKYYGNLGLSDSEMKARQKLCSRHRIKYNEKQSTPAGFWDPLFPDTYSSTFQDD